MSGTQKINKLSRKSKKKSALSQGKSLDDSLADFSEGQGLEQKSQQMEKKSGIFNLIKVKTGNLDPDQQKEVELNPSETTDLNHFENLDLNLPENSDLKPSENPDLIPRVSLADCPMCGKQFKPGLSGQRNSHLKSCGNKYGMSSNKLVELRRLEERQAEERAALRLPIVPVNKNVDKSPKKFQRKNMPIKDGGADADLELALALSISAQSRRQHVHSGKEVGNSRAQLGDIETDVANIETESLRCSQNGKSSMWLPQATVPQKKRGRKKVAGTTVLQTRSEAERERLVGEKVATLLYPEVEENPPSDRIVRACLPERKYNGRLVSFEDPEIPFWSIASLPETAKNKHFLAEKLDNYINIKHLGDCSDKKRDETVENSKCNETVENRTCNERILDEVKKSVQPSLKKLSDEWLNLFKSKKRADLKILCREEEVVFCHRLVLGVRCPKVLNETVKETANGMEEEIVIWSNFDYKVVLVFMEFLYCGVLNVSVIETIEELFQLKQIATFNMVVEIVDILKEITIEEVNENDITGGFCEGVDKESHTATQNLDALLDCLDSFEQDDEVKKNNVETVDEGEWDEVCEFMTQRAKKTVAISDRDDVEDFNLRISDSDDAISDEESGGQNKMTTLAQSKNTTSESFEKSNLTEIAECAKATISRASSPDMFGSDDCDDYDDDIIKNEWNLPPNISPARSEAEVNSSKRKTVLLVDSVNPSLKKRRIISPIHSTSPEHLISSPIRPISAVGLNFCDDSSELPTPNKYSPNSKCSSSRTLIKGSPSLNSPSNLDNEDDDIIDLTQPTPTPPNIPSSNDTEKSQKSIMASPLNSPMSSPVKSPKSVMSSPTKSLKSAKSSPLNLHRSAISSEVNSLKSVVSWSQSTSSPKSITLIPKSLFVKSKTSTIALINNLVEDLDDPSIGDKHTEAALETLCEFEVTVPMMLETSVGKIVRKLRDRDGRIGRLAGRLVARWKKLVFAYDGPELSRNRSIDVGLNSQKVTENPSTLIVIGDEEIVNDDAESVNEDEEGGHEVTIECEMEKSGDIWGRDENAIDDEIYKITNYDSGEIARLQMEDSAIWRSENEPVHISPTPQHHTTPHRTVQSLKKSAKLVTTPQNGPKSPTPLRIQSLKHSTKKSLTPKKSVKSANLFMTPENVQNRKLPDATPMADYDMMLTPELREELHRFGLKAVPRRKAVQLLQFIYDKTHPFVDKENSSPIVETKTSKRAETPKSNSISKSKMKTSAKKVRIAHKPSTLKSSVNSNISKSAKCSYKKSGNSYLEEPELDDVDLSQASTCSDQSQGSDVPEESMMQMDDDEDEITPSQMPTEGTLWSQLRSFINSKPELHHSILVYEPIWLKQFFTLVKQSGIKCKLAQVMDFLDQECITFRTETNKMSRQKKKKSPKKKSKASPLKKSPKKGSRKKTENQ